MIFDSISEEHRKRFFRQNYGAHLPGYTGHCPTLKFRVGKRFGACTEEIIKELLEKRILKEGPYRPNSARDSWNSTSMLYKKDTKAEWKSNTHLFKAPPYILGYTGYIPGFNSKYGLSFMRAVEEGAKEWRENQSKLRARVIRHDPNNFLSHKRTDNVAIEIDHDHDKNQMTYHYEISPERPPIVGYTGHIPGTKGDTALSRTYAQAAKRGLELVRTEREQRLSKVKDTKMVNKVLDIASVGETDTISK